MKAKDSLKIILICVFFWVFIIVGYYIGESHGRENAEAECKPARLYGYIDKHGELVWDDFPDAAYKMFYPEAVE